MTEHVDAEGRVWSAPDDGDPAVLMETEHVVNWSEPARAPGPPVVRLVRLSPGYLPMHVRHSPDDTRHLVFEPESVRERAAQLMSECTKIFMAEVPVRAGARVRHDPDGGIHSRAQPTASPALTASPASPASPALTATRAAELGLVSRATIYRLLRVFKPPVMLGTTHQQARWRDRMAFEEWLADASRARRAPVPPARAPRSRRPKPREGTSGVAADPWFGLLHESKAKKR